MRSRNVGVTDSLVFSWEKEVCPLRAFPLRQLTRHTSFSQLNTEQSVTWVIIKRRQPYHRAYNKIIWFHCSCGRSLASCSLPLILIQPSWLKCPHIDQWQRTYCTWITLRPAGVGEFLQAFFVAIVCHKALEALWWGCDEVHYLLDRVYWTVNSSRQLSYNFYISVSIFLFADSLCRWNTCCCRHHLWLADRVTRSPAD